MPSNSITSPKYKDSVFRMLFNDKKELLSLYNALNNSSHTNPDDIIINTIGDSTFLKVKNDVSFIFNYELNVFEHQSTPCPNMPLRDLFYVAKLLKKITQEDDLYSSKPVKIPTPKFYVFYNGTEPLPDEKIYRLSEQFEKQTATPDIELTVTVLNINEGNNQKLMGACNTLKSYSIFVSLVRKYIKEIPKDTDDREEALKSSIEHAIQDCIDQNILKTFFEEHGREVQDMTYWDYNEELHNKTIASEAAEKANTNAALEMIRLARKGNIPDVQTRKSIEGLGLPSDLIDELFTQIDNENLCDVTYWDYNEELHNKTIATEAAEKATIKDALEIIRFDQEEGIPGEKTRLRIKRLGLSDATIDELFAQIDSEAANLIQQ